MGPLSARGLLVWSLAAALAIQIFLQFSPRSSFTPIFTYLLYTGDAVGNWVLLMLTCCAYVLRRRSSEILAAIRIAGSRPWTMAAVLFPLLCLGSLRIYHDHPLSMDEYAAIFQAKAFAAGRLSGVFPPEMLDELIPVFHQNSFLAVSRATGEVSSKYWPGFALLATPFVWLNAAWAVNPAIGALAVPAVHRLTREITGSREAAAWAVVMTAASPAFIVDSISYYSMQAHLLGNILFLLLILRPTAPRAIAAGLVGSVALTLHQPVPHLLFLLPCVVWLAMQPGSGRALASLAAGYLPLGILLGWGWQMHLVELSGTGASLTAPATAAAGAPVAAESSYLQASLERLRGALALPNAAIAWMRIAGLVKVWTWGAAGLLVLAAFGCIVARANPAIKLLGVAFLVTFLGYFVFPMDQGHGWGNRYIHSAWIAIPVLAAAGLVAVQGEIGKDLRAMTAWLMVLSLTFANALRLAEVKAFTASHLAQVPPLVRPVPRDGRQIIFARINAGSYIGDLVQNDPFLRGNRIVMVYGGEERTVDLMRRRFPEYVKEISSNWGELWTARQATPER